MQIKKTVGTGRLDMYIKGQGRKGYIIHTDCGEKFHAKPVGSQSYECGGANFQSLKARKTHIIEGGFDEDTTEPAEASTADGADTWDCVHPCALLAHLYDLGILGELGYKHKGIKEAYTETLGNYGWLDCVGRPDIARAEREIKRVENLKKGN